jgi:hypothetical protein
MAYSDFTLPLVKERLGLTVAMAADLFGAVPERDPPPHLAGLLARYMPLAVNLGTEKARSELVIAPVLIEFVLEHRGRLSLFSGVEFTVDEAVGLRGRCDFILSRSPEQLALSAPACVLVEAKREDIVGGVPQCLAEMVAAQRFNRAAGLPDGPVFGAVTTGLRWRFLRLDGTAAAVDVVEYPIELPRKLVGILAHVTGVSDR